MTTLISIVTPCFNEEANVDELCARIAAVMAQTKFEYEHILIDNSSTDGTLVRLRAIASADARVKVIVNARNFGHIRSPYHAMLQARGDAVIVMVSDLQDPPEIIPEFIARWEAGFKVVLAMKTDSDESKAMFALRRLYYRIIDRISDVPLIHDATGAGLYDRQVVEIMRGFHDPYPYGRGMVSEIGLPTTLVPFVQPRRSRGVTKNNFYSLFDTAMLGMTSHSKVPLRLMTILGFAVAALSVLVTMAYIIAKLVFWNSFQAGIAPILIGMFFLGGLQILMLGMIGEYVGAILTRVRNLPHVIELERINFDK